MNLLISSHESNVCFYISSLLQSILAVLICVFLANKINDFDIAETACYSPPNLIFKSQTMK